MKKIKYLLFLLLLLPAMVYSASPGSINCDKTNVTRGDIINCELSINASDSITVFNGTVSGIASNFTINKITGLNGFSSSSDSVINLSNPSGKTGNFTLAKIELKVNTDASYGNQTITLSSADLTSNVSVTLKVVSGDSTLKSLTIDDYGFAFKSNTYTYNLNINASSIKINAEVNDSKASFVPDMGPREVNLDYGQNEVKVMVTAENGDITTYVLKINREDSRNKVNYLSALTVTSGTTKLPDLNPIFNREKIDYILTVPLEIEKVSIGASLAHIKSKFVTDFGPKEVNLNTGENIVLIKVESESGDIRTYTIKINRSSESDNNFLKSLTIKNSNITFVKDIIEYNINVLNDITELEIDAKAEHEKAKVEIIGNTNLSEGINKVLIKVTAENKSERIYTINVTRLEKGSDLSDNNLIKELTIENYNIGFDKARYEYNLKIKKETSLDISVLLEDEFATYEIIGNENLKNKSKIIIKVTAENGDIKEYVINIEKSSTTLLYIIIIVIVLILIGLGITLYIYRSKWIPIFFEKVDQAENPIIDEEKKIIYDQDLEKTVEYKPIEEEILTFEED